MVDELLSRLEKVKSVGKGKWQACCPVHGDRNPSMSIKEEPDGKVLCYCFACGAKGVDVVESVGLPTSVLFSPESEFDRRQYKAAALRKEKESDEIFISIYKAWEKAGKYICLSDKKRYRQAVNRLESINTILVDM